MKSFIVDENFFVFKNKKYDNVYDVIVNNKKIFNMIGFITFCAAIGFKNNKRKVFNERGKEIRTVYFNESQLTAVYSILLTDEKYGKNINILLKEDSLKDSMKIIEEYAEGGMELLLEEFGKLWSWNGTTISNNYDNYETDLLMYVLRENNKDSF